MLQISRFRPTYVKILYIFSDICSDSNFYLYLNIIQISTIFNNICPFGPGLSDIYKVYCYFKISENIYRHLK